MSKKSKKSESHQNKIIVLGIIAMIVIVAIVLIVQDNITARITADQFANKCTSVVPNIKLTREQCIIQGLEECAEKNPLWQYAMSKPSMCYTQCEWQVRDICKKNAPFSFPHQ